MTHFARCNSILCTTSRKKERETGKEKPGRFSFSDPQKTSSTSLGSWQSKLIEHKHLRWWPARASPLWNSVTPDSLVNNYKSSLVAGGIEVVSILPFLLITTERKEKEEQFTMDLSAMSEQSRSSDWEVGSLSISCKCSSIWWVFEKEMGEKDVIQPSLVSWLDHSRDASLPVCLPRWLAGLE